MSDKHDWQSFSVELAMTAKKNLDAKDDEITRLQSEVERLRGRVTWFEEWRDRFIDACDANPRAWLLIKQAEAVEAAVVHVNGLYGHDGSRFTDFSNYAQRLRQQAAESESQQEENDD